MKNSGITFSTLAITLLSFTFVPLSGKTPSSKTLIKFFSHTNHIVDIDAENYSSESTLDLTTGDIEFYVPMQDFEFKNAQMQRHYNRKEFMDTEHFPTTHFRAKIKAIDKIDFHKDGVYKVTVEGNMRIKGATKKIKEKGKITVKNGIITVESVITITFSDYKIIFWNNQLSADIQKKIKVSVFAEYPAK